MTLRTWISLFLRHASFAGAWLLLVLVLAERLAPGSVLPYFNLYWLLVCVMVLVVLAPKTEGSRPWRVVWFIPILVLLAIFFALVLSGASWSALLLISFITLAVAVLSAIAYPDPHG